MEGKFDADAGEREPDERDPLVETIRDDDVFIMKTATPAPSYTESTKPHRYGGSYAAR